MRALVQQRGLGRRRPVTASRDAAVPRWGGFRSGKPRCVSAAGPLTPRLAPAAKLLLLCDC